MPRWLRTAFPCAAAAVSPLALSLSAGSIPSRGGVVRHIVAAPNDELWLARSGAHRVARARRSPK